MPDRHVKTAPWRMEYLKNTRMDGCFICDALLSDPGPETLVLVKTTRSAVMLNRYPYNNGHLMIVPIAHVSALNDLPAAVIHELMDWTAIAERILTESYAPQGFNVGMNIGAAAGAGLATHLHIHILPRWSGDTNFMTTVGDVRVVPELLGDTWHRLAPGFQATGGRIGE